VTDFRQLRTILPVGAPVPQRDRIPIGYWLAACLVGAIAANALANLASPGAVANPPSAETAPLQIPPAAQTATDLSQLWAAAAAKSPHAGNAAAPSQTNNFRRIGERYAQQASQRAAGRFTVCGPGRRVNCVVDGDTFWVDGQKVRIADIDTPEIHNPRCAREMQMGRQAKQRLLESLNSGSFALESSGRDRDRYGRALRRVTRNGRSVGEGLVGEGLAHEWDGRRHPWCD
jgi:micrococcal nuclease